MRYKSSELIKRALNLADISNTDFLTYTELEQYLNDAWTTVFNWLISKGDHQFVKEVILETSGSFNDWTEYQIPSDLYQISSIKNKYSGSLIERAAISEGINCGKYDIVNDRIRLYGAAAGPLLLTYWYKPEYISFPDKDIEVSNVNGGIMSTAGNSVLVIKDGIVTVTNTVTKETLGSFSEPTEGIWNSVWKLGNGHIVIETGDAAEHYITYLDYSGHIIEDVPFTDETVTYFLDENYDVCYQLLKDGKYSAPYKMGVPLLNETLEFDNPFVLGLDDLYIVAKTIDGKSYFTVYEAYEDQEWSDFPIPFIPSSGFRVDDFDGKPTFLLSDSQTNNIIMVCLNTDDKTVEYENVDVKALSKLAIVKYGILTTNGSYTTLKSYIPDTDMNFPNELYFSLLACDLAVRFAMKMNANTDGLSNLYQNMQTTFMNSLSQSSGYTRIKNVYR